MKHQTVAALLLNWKRSENLIEVIDSIKNQSIPIKICLWNNNPEDSNDYNVDLQINSEENFKCWPRWLMGSFIDADFIFTLDDDLKLSDSRVIEDILIFYSSLDKFKDLDPIVGYTGVTLNDELDYWKSRHIVRPEEIDTRVDIIKGRFMFMERDILNKSNLENEPTCEDIKISALSGYKIIPNFLKGRMTDLKDLGVGLFGSPEHEKNRNDATKKYFGDRKLVDLKTLMNIYGSDKGGCGRFSCHNYTDIYDMLFGGFRLENNNIFELGLGTNNTQIISNMGPLGKPGASLRGWKDYFINSFIYGADIDKKVLFSEERIETFYCDQTDPNSISEMWSDPLLSDKFFDVIIDDGLHEYHANVNFFENSIFKLKKGGYYIVEDLNPNTLELFKTNIDFFKIKYPFLQFNILSLFHEENNNDNNLLIIRKNL
jgi:hypothetical protein